jgi:hypothetical protein
MHYKTLLACASAVLLATAVACSNDNPVSPSSPEPGGSSNETLKATAPTPQSPVNNQQPDGGLTLVATKSSSPFSSSSGAYSYEFEVMRGGTAVAGCTRTVPGGNGSTVSHTPACTLEFDQIYSWHARAVFQDRQGPWSEEATFRAPAGGYIRGNEVYDPLINGETVGEVVGPVTFIPGVGVRLEGFTSHIRYRLPQTLASGEFSLIMTGVTTNTEGHKTKVLAMSEGLDDIVTNNRRMTVEKRGDPAGAIAWRLISHLDQIETVGLAERVRREFDPNVAYLWTATWNGRFTVRIQRGGSDGPTMYNFGKNYQGAYDPDPHYAFIGAPVGRSGTPGATVPGMIVRHVWISSRPRPAGLN